MDDNIKFLKGISLFKGVDEQGLADIIKITKEVSYGEREKVILEGTDSTTLYIIKSGLVHITKEIDEVDKLLSMLGAGDFFGEMCLFAPGLRSATASAIKKTTLIEIEKRAFDRLVEEKPRVATKILYAMMEEMARRVRGSNEMVKNWVMWVKAVQEAGE